MSHAVLEHTARAGSVLRAEVHRFWSRRLVLALLGLSLLGFAAFGVIAFTQYAQPTAADLAQARQQIAQSVAQNEAARQECLADPPPADQLPPGLSVEDACGEPARASDYELRYFLDRPPFVLADEYQAFATAVGFGTAAVAFLVGVTFVGAEWSQRTMVALLFWQPRRGVVVSRKLAVATVAGAVLAAVYQVLWFGLARLLGATRGTTDTPDGFLADVLAQGARIVLFGALLGLLGAAAANLVRGTAAVLGVAFVYLALVETLVRALGGELQQYLLTTSAAALAQLDRVSVYVEGDTVVQPDGSVYSQGREILVSGLQGGIVLGVTVAVVVAVGTALFMRRDVG